MNRKRKKACHFLWLSTVIAVLLLCGKPCIGAEGEWKWQNPPPWEDLVGVWGSSGTDAFAVGDRGAILHDSLSNRLFLPMVTNHYKGGNILLMRCEQGLFRSSNGGDHWTMLSPTNGYLIANDFGNPGQVLWARSDGLWKSQDQGLNWTAVGPFGAGQGVPVTQLATMAGMSNIIYASFENSPGKITGPLYSLDGGLSWQKVTTAPWEFPNLFMTYAQQIRVALSPRPGQPIPVRLITAASASPYWDSPNYYHGDLYRSGDYGSTWAQLDFLQSFPVPGSIPEFHFPDLIASPVDPNRLYLSNYYIDLCRTSDCELYRLFTSVDGGITWIEIDQGYRTPGEIAASPILPDRVYRMGPVGWLQSDNGGQTWIKKDFPSTLRDLVLDSQDPARMYGLDPNYQGRTSSDGGTTWQTWAEQPCGTSFKQLLAP